MKGVGRAEILLFFSSFEHHKNGKVLKRARN